MIKGAGWKCERAADWWCERTPLMLCPVNTLLINVRHGLSWWKNYACIHFHHICALGAIKLSQILRCPKKVMETNTGADKVWLSLIYEYQDVLWYNNSMYWTYTDMCCMLYARRNMAVWGSKPYWVMFWIMLGTSDIAERFKSPESQLKRRQSLCWLLSTDAGAWLHITNVNIAIWFQNYKLFL